MNACFHVLDKSLSWKWKYINFWPISFFSFFFFFFLIQESLRRVLQEKLEAVRKISDLEVSIVCFENLFSSNTDSVLLPFPHTAFLKFCKVTSSKYFILICLGVWIYQKNVLLYFCWKLYLYIVHCFVLVVITKFKTITNLFDFIGHVFFFKRGGGKTPPSTNSILSQAL